MESEEQTPSGGGGRTEVGSAAIKWSAVVIIVLAVLYFLAQFVIPLFE